MRRNTGNGPGARPCQQETDKDSEYGCCKEVQCQMLRRQKHLGCKKETRGKRLRKQKETNETPNDRIKTSRTCHNGTKDRQTNANFKTAPFGTHSFRAVCCREPKDETNDLKHSPHKKSRERCAGHLSTHRIKPNKKNAKEQNGSILFVQHDIAHRLLALDLHGQPLRRS